MHATPSPGAEDTLAALITSDADAFDDSYAWVGYESALPQTLDGADGGAFGSDTMQAARRTADT